MKKIPTRISLLAAVLLALPLLFYACQQESLGPTDTQDNSETLATLARISANNFATKTTVSQGFAGTVFKITRGEWAVGGFVIEDATPAQANVGVYDMQTSDSILYFRAPDPVLIAQTQSDGEGFYQFELNTGYYLVLVSEEELPDTLLMYDVATGMDWFNPSNMLMTSLEVMVDSVRKIDFYLEPEDYSYPGWPPDDSSIVVPPDSFWTWPGDSTDYFTQYDSLLQRNREKVTIGTGVYGTVSYWPLETMLIDPTTGMFSSGAIEPAQYPVRVYEGVTWGSDDLDVYPNSMIVQAVHSTLLAESVPDSEGFYQFELPAGTYSVFAVIGQDSLIFEPDMTMGPMGPMPGAIPPGEIVTGDVREVNLSNSDFYGFYLLAGTTRFSSNR